jgi:1-acyl-sn-glycerol-3-phosphate acyltransferase
LSAYHYWLVRHVLGIRFEWDGTIPEGPFRCPPSSIRRWSKRSIAALRPDPGGGDEEELMTMPQVRLGNAVTARSGFVGSRDRHSRDDGQGKQAVVEGRPVVIFRAPGLVGRRRRFGRVLPAYIVRSALLVVPWR